MTALKLENVSKRFSKTVWGVKKIDLEVREQEFLVLLGPSGCGKTTTLRMIAGLEDATSGNIFLYDQDITDAPPRKRGISMVFQSYAVWPHMKVFDNIAFALRLQKLPKVEIKETVTQVAEMVKISELLDRFPRQLSGGQRQRVALARALAVKPKLFLLDEPLSNLDAKLRVAMRTELKAIHRRSKATSIFVTHDQSEAMSMADSIVVMRDGIVIQSGTPDDVYSRSADTFVAGFIGTPPTNFFNVEVQKDNGTIKLKHQDFQLALESDASRELSDYAKKELILGVRPEDIQIVKADEAVISHKVLVVEPQGSHQIIAIEIQDSIVKIWASADLPVQPDEVLHLNFKQSRLHFFDSETEKRVTSGAAVTAS